MEALIADIDADMKLLKREIESVKRKLGRLKTEKDRENIDSHHKAVALLCIPCIPVTRTLSKESSGQ